MEIKEEPEELSIKPEEEPLPVCVPESSDVCVKREESSLLQQRPTEHKEETQTEDVSSEPQLHSPTEGHTDDGRDPPLSGSSAQREPEPEGDHSQVPPRDKNTAVNDGDVSGAEEAECKHDDVHTEGRPFRCVPESSDVCVKTEESSLLQQRPTEHKEEPQTEDTSSEPQLHSPTEGDASDAADRDLPLTCWSAKTEAEAEGDHGQVQTRSTAGNVSGRAEHKHDDVHAEDRPFRCSICAKTFTQHSVLNAHIREHPGETLYICVLCQKEFGNKSTLDTHMRAHTRKPYSCSICEKTFEHEGYFQQHMRNHTGQKPYSCSWCERTFAQINYLESHVKIHREKETYSCSDCKRTFPFKSVLKTHMRTHTSDRPYSCSVCGKTFSQRNTLNVHTRIHTGEKPYSCSVCNKAFVQLSHLNYHMNALHKDAAARAAPGSTLNDSNKTG